MPRTIIPASAKGAVYREKPLIILQPNFCEWLARIIAPAKPARCNIRRRRDSSGQAILLDMILAPDTAIWTLCATDLFQAVYRDRNDVWMQQTIPSEILSIQAHVLHIDMFSRNEMSFKLTPDTVRGLIGFYDSIPYDLRSSSLNGSRKDNPRRAFVRKVSDFVLCTSISALESLQKDGTGRLDGLQEQTARQAVDLLMISELAPQPQGSLSQCCQSRTHIRGQIDMSHGHSSLETSNFENQLSETTLPYHSFAHSIYLDPSFSPGAPRKILPPPCGKAQLPPMYDQLPSRGSLFQWPSMNLKDTQTWDGSNETGTYYMSGWG